MSYFDDVILPRIHNHTYYTKAHRKERRMAYEHKPNTGSLFKNDKKGNDKAPDYKGDCLVNGEKLQLAAWIKDGSKGKFLSISFKEPYKPEARTDYQAPSYQEDPFGFDADHMEL